MLENLSQHDHPKSSNMIKTILGRSSALIAVTNENSNRNMALFLFTLFEGC